MAKKSQFVVEGFFTKAQAETIKATLNGKTFLKWEIEIGNSCGNHSIIVSSEYNCSLDELKETFMYYLLCEVVRKDVE